MNCPPDPVDAALAHLRATPGVRDIPIPFEKELTMSQHSMLTPIATQSRPAAVIAILAGVFLAGGAVGATIMALNSSAVLRGPGGVEIGVTVDEAGNASGVLSDGTRVELAPVDGAQFTPPAGAQVQPITGVQGLPPGVQLVPLTPGVDASPAASPK